VQQLVGAGQAEGLAELLGRDPLGIPPPQRTQIAIGGGGTGQEPPAELLLLLGGQFGRPSAARLGPQRLDAAVAVGIGPALDEAAAAGQGLWPSPQKLNHRL